jgi:hypothetical protein
MAAVLITVHLVDVNGIPADDVENTFCMANSASSAAPLSVASNVFDSLKSFYNDGGSGPAQVGHYLGGNIDRTANKMKMVAYQLAPTGSITPVTPLGGPIDQISWTLEPTPGSAVDLPRECAAVLSLQTPAAGIAEDTPGGVAGPRGDTHPAARRRGRIYLGPLNASAMGTGANGPGLTATFRDAVCAAAGALNAHVASIPGATHFWGIWSRKNTAIYPITTGWMDDAFDTQRRRGIGSTARSTFGL